MLELGPAMSPSGNTRPREHDANPNPWYLASFGIWVCNVPVWEHQSSALWACSVPLRNTRPREHDASLNPRFLAPWSLRSMAYNRNKTALTAPKGAGALSSFCLTRGEILL